MRSKLKLASLAVVAPVFALAACSSSSEEPDLSAPSGQSNDGGSIARTAAMLPCRGTLSGAASGDFTCVASGLFFLPTYQSDKLRGNTQVSLVSSTELRTGMSPPGIASIVWAGVFPGELKPGTYTHEQLIQTEFSAAGVSFADNQQISGVSRLTLTVTRVTARGVNEDLFTKRGPMRNDHPEGSIELVLGTAPRQVTISATLE